MSAATRRPRPARWPQLVAGLLTVSWTVGAPAQASLPEPAHEPESNPVSRPARAPRQSAPVVELNEASRARLESVAGIGPALALALVQARDDGPFADWADVIARVKGVGPASARRLSAHGLRVRGRALDTEDDHRPST